MSSPIANARRLNRVAGSNFRKEIPPVILILYLKFNISGSIQLAGSKGATTRLVKPEGTFLEDYRNPLSPPVLLKVKSVSLCQL